MNYTNLNDIKISYHRDMENLFLEIYNQGTIEYVLKSTKDTRVANQILLASVEKRMIDICELTQHNEYNKKLLINYISDVGVFGCLSVNSQQRKFRKFSNFDMLNLLQNKLIKEHSIAKMDGTDVLTMGVGKYTNYTKAYVPIKSMYHGTIIDNDNCVYRQSDNHSDLYCFAIEEIRTIEEDRMFRSVLNSSNKTRLIAYLPRARRSKFSFGNPIDCEYHEMTNQGLAKLGYVPCNDCGIYSKGVFVNSENICTKCEDLQIVNHIHSYSYKPHPRYFRLANGNVKGFENPHFHKFIYLGIEIETSIRRKHRRNMKKIVNDIIEGTKFGGRRLFYAKYDGSLGDYGVEFVSHPMTYNAFNKIDWDEVFSSFRSQIQSYSDDRCGIHIHLSRNVMSDFTMTKFMDLMYQNVEFTELIAQRDTSEWANLNPHHFDDFKSITKQMKNRKSEQYDRFIKAQFGERYSAINFNNKPTIEIRIFKGNLKTERLKKNVEYLMAMREFCEFSSLKDIKVSNFVGFVKSNWKSFPNLNRFLNQFNKSLKQIIGGK